MVQRARGHRCYYCAADLRRYRSPRSRGGTDALANLVLACRPCGEAKGGLTFGEFRRRVQEERPARRAMPALSELLANERALASPGAFRRLWACADRAGHFVFPGEELEASTPGADPVGAARPSRSLLVPQGECEVPPGRILPHPIALGMLKRYWLKADGNRLVELDSSRSVEVRTSREGALGVWLCGGGIEVLLYEGSDAHTYLAGLARSLGAASAEDVLRLGRRATP